MQAEWIDAIATYSFPRLQSEFLIFNNIIFISSTKYSSISQKFSTKNFLDYSILQYISSSRRALVSNWKVPSWFKPRQEPKLDQLKFFVYVMYLCWWMFICSTDSSCFAVPPRSHWLLLTQSTTVNLCWLHWTFSCIMCSDKEDQTSMVGGSPRCYCLDCPDDEREINNGARTTWESIWTYKFLFNRNQNFFLKIRWFSLSIFWSWVTTVSVEFSIQSPQVNCVCVLWLCTGVEPWSFYFANGFLNFNVVFFLALLAIPLIEFEVRKSIAR